MDLAKLTLTETPAGVRLLIKVVPGARASGIVGELGGALKVTVTAAPERGQANRAVIAVLARQLGVPASALVITRGHTGPRKEVLVTGVSLAELTRFLRGAIE